MNNVYCSILILFIIACSSLNASQKKIALASGDNVNIRTSGNIYSKILGRLKLGDDVTIYKKSGKTLTISGKKGQWVYIDSHRFLKGSRETVKGWVFNYYLVSDYSKFKRLRRIKIKNRKFGISEGDASYEFDFFSNGSYKMKFKGEYNNKPPEYSKGYLYKYKKLVMLKDSTGSVERVFYINENGKLCSGNDAQRNPICTNCQID